MRPVDGWLGDVLGQNRLSGDRARSGSYGGPNCSSRVLIARMRPVGWRPTDLLGQLTPRRAPCSCGDESRVGVCRGCPHVQLVIVWRGRLLGQRS